MQLYSYTLCLDYSAFCLTPNFGLTISFCSCSLLCVRFWCSLAQLSKLANFEVPSCICKNKNVFSSGLNDRRGISQSLRLRLSQLITKALASDPVEGSLARKTSKCLDAVNAAVYVTELQVALYRRHGGSGDLWWNGVH